MVWLMLLLVWATTAILVAAMWGKLVQWGEVGDHERIRRSPPRVSRMVQVWEPYWSVKRRHSKGRHDRAFLCAIHRRHCLQSGGSVGARMAELRTQRYASPVGNGKSRSKANGL
jgi:hypothetical protein